MLWVSEIRLFIKITVLSLKYLILQLNLTIIVTFQLHLYEDVYNEIKVVKIAYFASYGFVIRVTFWHLCTLAVPRKIFLSYVVLEF